MNPLGGLGNKLPQRFFSSERRGDVVKAKAMPEIETNDIPTLIDDQLDFELISSVKANQIHTVNKYISRSTGTVIIKYYTYNNIQISMESAVIF